MNCDIEFDQELSEEVIEIYEDKLELDFKAMTADQLCELGYVIEKGIEGRKKDLYLAFILYHLAAEKGYIFAYNNLAWMYQKGYGIKQDIDKALKYYKIAAIYGHTIAMLNIGGMYEDKKEYKEAFEWYQKAGHKGDTRGTYNVANMYYHGWHVEQNLKLAWEYFKMLYEKEDEKVHANCCFYLGLYEQKGYRGKKDYEKAVQYYKEGVEHESGVCMTQLGMMYSDGLGVLRNQEKAFELFIRAVVHGDNLSYNNVGNCYEKGQGIEKDMDMALAYYKKGCKLGEEHATENYKRLTSYEK